jgi:hypothetical protein
MYSHDMVLAIMDEDLKRNSQCEACNVKPATFCMLFNEKQKDSCTGMIAISQLCDLCADNVVLTDTMNGKLICKDRKRHASTYPEKAGILARDDREW